MKKMRINEPLDNLYPLPKPVLMRKGIELLLKSNYKGPENILSDLSFPKDDVEILCNLPIGSLNLKTTEPKVKLNIL